MEIHAISLDLDDTLWPVAPVLQRAETHLHEWLRTHCSQVAQDFPVSAMRELRDRIFAENIHLSHDFSELRKITLRTAFAPHGLGEEWVDRAFAEFVRVRNEVDYYEDTLSALERLSARLPLISISNGNADLERIGINHFFQFSIHAREHGVAKPDPGIFHAACTRLNLAPQQVMHVGDDLHLDVVGAKTAGLRTAWLNRQSIEFLFTVSTELATPDLVIHTLDELADWVDHHFDVSKKEKLCTDS